MYLVPGAIFLFLFLEFYHQRFHFQKILYFFLFKEPFLKRFEREREKEREQGEGQTEKQSPH